MPSNATMVTIQPTSVSGIKPLGSQSRTPGSGFDHRESSAVHRVAAVSVSTVERARARGVG